MNHAILLNKILPETLGALLKIGFLPEFAFTSTAISSYTLILLYS